MALRLYWNNEQDAMEISEALAAKLEELLSLAGASEDTTDGAVALSFVDDEEIRRLNRDFRGIDKATDVLSFPQMEAGENEPDINYDDLGEMEEIEGTDDGEEDDEEGEDGSDDFDGEEPLGDIVISIPRAVSQAEEYGHSVDREIGFLFIHGFLHLLGYDHESEEEERIMTDKQERILQAAGLTR